MEVRGENSRYTAATCDGSAAQGRRNTIHFTQSGRTLGRIRYMVKYGGERLLSSGVYMGPVSALVPTLDQSGHNEHRHDARHMATVFTRHQERGRGVLVRQD